MIRTSALRARGLSELSTKESSLPAEESERARLRLTCVLVMTEAAFVLRLTDEIDADVPLWRSRLLLLNDCIEEGTATPE